MGTMVELMAAIRKPRGIDDLVSNFSAEAEEERSVEQFGDNPVSAVLKEYEAFLGKYNEYQKMENLMQWFKDQIQNQSDILTPAEINLFLQATIGFEERKKYSELTGIFITRLIQNSYNAGHNNFKLNTKNRKGLHYFGSFLEGKEGNPLTIYGEGDVGHLCFNSAEHIIFSIKGNVGQQCGHYATNSIFSIRGDVRFELGYSATHCTFLIEGNLGDRGSWMAKKSTFKTPNEKTLEKLRRDVPINNTIIYVRQDGTEEVIR